LILVLAGLQDPGNLGTILRSAEAFGATGIVALTRTVSAWNPKAVRASAGSVFRVPLIASTAEDCITRLHRAEVSIWSTAALPEAATEASGHDPGSRTAGESRSGTSVDSDQSRFVSGHDFSRAEKAPKNDGALAPGTPIAAHHANLAGPVALIIGNEGNGVPPELAARADATITIPCPGPVESLNAAVAASILLYEAAQQRASQPSTKQAARKVE
jgi:TrmH family RNA methyltransferase